MWDPRTSSRRVSCRCIAVHAVSLACLWVLASVPLTAQPAASQTLLRSPEGHILHSTSRPVHEQRQIEMDGNPLRLHLWQEELDDGSRLDFYAFSDASGRVAGRVRGADYTLYLAGVEADPLREDFAAKDSLPEVLTAQADNRLFLLQMEAPPLPRWRQSIEQQGVEILRYVPANTFLVKASAVQLASLMELPFVRWGGPYHPLYRLQEALRSRLASTPLQSRGEVVRYSILLASRGTEAQARLRATLEAAGGRIDLVDAGGLRLEATLSDAQLLIAAHANEVQFIDRWGGPGEVDLDVVRRVGGANYVENHTGWNGDGVRGEIFDSELLLDHQEWGLAPIVHSQGTQHPNLHGSSCFSANFSRGLQASTRGLLPHGQGIFFRFSESSQFGGQTSRYQINRELIDPDGPYRAVFQSSSVGSARTTEYTTVSAEIDDILFHHPILSVQSQSNAGSRMSRPQAWAKNIVSVGGIQHRDSERRCDDVWGRTSSIGPAADGRVKPDLIYFNDSIHTAAGGSVNAYVQFGGTSAATPVTAGHFGLLFQMWHEGVWEGHGGGDDVFASRPQMATAKALMINTAFRYNWTSSGSCTYDDVDRFKQGWGTSDLQRLYRRAALTSVVDADDPILPLEVKTYPVQVIPERKALNVTLVYTDPIGLVGATQARVNDLSLRVTDPSGTSYWGNYGLDQGNASLPGGQSNTIDTVENVFVPFPMPGQWTVEVFADEVVEDSHLETSQLDADFALVVSGGVIAACNATCGNGVVECRELCDGTDLGVLDCSDGSCSSSPLLCNATCDGLRSSASGTLPTWP